jgi:hypothetical protein
MNGFLEVGISDDGREVIVNHPQIDQDERGGWIGFTPAEARALAADEMTAHDASAEPR